MDRHGDREAEDELRGGGGLATRCRRACSLHCTRCGQDLRLKLQELPHEAEVGGDDAPPLLDELEGLLQLQQLLLHQVREADGGGTRDASLAVD